MRAVSGGGFVAGYLAALGQRARYEAGLPTTAEENRRRAHDGRGGHDDATGTTNFHNEPDGDRRLYPLGTEPSGALAAPGEPGGANRARLGKAGRYVNDMASLAGLWLLGTLPVLALFLSGLGLMSAAAALVWRAADTHWFFHGPRAMGLGDFGQDLGVAFLPVVPVFWGWLAVQSAAGRRTAGAAAAWLTALPWAAGAMLCVPLFRSAGWGAGESWSVTLTAAGVLPVLGWARLAAGRFAARDGQRDAAEDYARGAGPAWPVRAARWAFWGTLAAGAAGLTWAAYSLLHPAAGTLPTADPGAPLPLTVAVALTLLLTQAVPAFSVAALRPSSGGEPAEPAEPAGDRRPAGRLRVYARLATLALLAAVVVGVAVFLGNGVNSVGRAATTAETSLRWESWAGWLGLAAGAIQLITVLGFDSLFRSQQADAPPWKRAAFRVVLSLVLGLPAFAALHWFASEDISNHTTERSRTLTLGDIDTGPALAAEIAEVDALEAAIWPITSEELRRAERRLAEMRDALVGPAGGERRLTNVRGIWDRFETVYWGGARKHPADGSDVTWKQYIDARRHRQDLWEAALSGINGGPNERLAKRREFALAAKGAVAALVPRPYGVLLASRLFPRPRTDDGKVISFDGLRGETLARELMRLVEAKAEQQPLTSRRDEEAALAPGEPRPAEVRASLGDDGFSFLARPGGPASASELRANTQRRRRSEELIRGWSDAVGGRDRAEFPRLWDRATNYGLEDAPPGEGEHFTLEGFREPELARFNHLMLSALFPVALKPTNLPSTTLVTGDDQRFRLGMLLLCGSLFGFLLAGWVDFNRHSPSFQFYLDGLRAVFLDPAAYPPARRPAPQVRSFEPDPPAGAFDPDPLLKDVESWRAGLPLHLFVATLNVRRGRVFYAGGPDAPVGDPGAALPLCRPAAEHPPFVFSPLACGSRQAGLERTETYAGGGLRLAHAMTASGSAVSPYYFDHAWLTWFMTATNMRLGVWLPRPGGCSAAGGVAGWGPGRGSWVRRALRSGAFSWPEYRHWSLYRQAVEARGELLRTRTEWRERLAASDGDRQRASDACRQARANHREARQGYSASGGFLPLWRLIQARRARRNTRQALRRRLREPAAECRRAWRDFQQARDAYREELRAFRASPHQPDSRLPAAGALPVLREWGRIFRRSRVDEYDLGFVADGGFRDNLGVEQLLARRCRLVVAADAGFNHGTSEFTALADLVALARREYGVEFLDLDADGPLDLDRFLKREVGKSKRRFAPQQVLALRIRYPARPGVDGLRDEPACEGLLMYVQMALTGREEVDLRQARSGTPTSRTSRPATKSTPRPRPNSTAGSASTSATCCAATCRSRRAKRSGIARCRSTACARGSRCRTCRSAPRRPPSPTARPAPAACWDPGRTRRSRGTWRSSRPTISSRTSAPRTRPGGALWPPVSGRPATSPPPGRSPPSRRRISGCGCTTATRTSASTTTPASGTACGGRRVWRTGSRRPAGRAGRPAACSPPGTSRSPT